MEDSGDVDLRGSTMKRKVLIDDREEVEEQGERDAFSFLTFRGISS